MTQIEIPFSVAIRGDIHAELVDTKSEKVVETRDIRNTILNQHLNFVMGSTYFFGHGSDYCGVIPAHALTCKLGTSGQAPARTDAGLIGSELASVGSTTNTLTGIYPIVRTAYFVFPAGVGTGTIREVLLVRYYNISVARQIFEPEIVKNATQELRVTWTFTLSREADSWSGTITAGQRDGITDINWVGTINNMELGNWAYTGASRAYTGNIYVCTGTSNAPSDLANDAAGAIKGSALFTGIPAFRTVYPYVQDSYYRDWQLGFEIGQSNGAIGEIVVWYAGDSSSGLFRCTFNPALDKISGFRLYLRFRFSLGGLS